MQHVKHPTDSDAFLGMGGLIDQIVHDGQMDESRLDQILFSSNAGKTGYIFEDTLPALMHLCLLMMISIDPSHSVGSTLPDQTTMRQSPITERNSNKSMGNCRFGAGNHNPFQSYPSHRLPGLPPNQARHNGGMGYPPNSQRPLVVGDSSSQVHTYTQLQPRASTAAYPPANLNSTYPAKKIQQETEKMSSPMACSSSKDHDQSAATVSESGPATP
ncbi:hypothetical protein COOONC_15398 [Cooperia oncophora]